MKLSTTSSLLTLVLSSSLLLVGCFHDDDDDNNNGTPNTTARYQVTVTNLTNNQPLSPPMLALHGPAFEPWNIGSAASTGLETLAEGGDSSVLVIEAEADASVKTINADDTALPPGDTRSYTVQASRTGDLEMTMATMLVNTNDAFTGAGKVQIGDMAVGETRTLYGNVYDAGTEDNTETAATIPGPAGGGEGFNSARETRDIVTMHGGVVTADDGLATSALDQSHRFDNPAVRIVVTRL